MKEIWQNPEIQQINRLPMRSPLFPFANEAAAVDECAAGPESVDFTQSEFIKSLDGKWKFFLQESACAEENSSRKNWFSENFDDASWKEISVPGTWTLQNFGDFPHYTNIQMPFSSMPPFVPKKNPTGLYRLQTKIPARWKNRRIVLHIGASESCTLVWINGEFCGASKDSRLACEFDITQFLNCEKNSQSLTIAIKVVRYSDASFVEDQDQWWFGGIFRSVYLYSTEKIFIKDIKALTRVENFFDGEIICEEKKSARKNPIEKFFGIIPLRIQVGISQCDFGKKNSPAQNEIPFDLKILGEKRVAAKYSIYELRGVPAKGEVGKKIASGKIFSSLDFRETLNELRADIKINSPKLWSSEIPNLYIVSVTLCVEENSSVERELESCAFTIGFKNVRIKNRQLLINGKAVYIHGVNRHEHNERTGKTLSIQEMVFDAKQMKAYNFNAVRTCHYPDDERWYEICNRYGIYVLDEANIENHAYYDNIARDDEWTNAYTTRVQRMFRRDKNNACIFGWSLGNESGVGQNHIMNAAYLRAVDKTRIIHYEGFARDEFKQNPFTLQSLSNGKEIVDLISPMYPTIDLIVEYAKKCDDHRPIIMCEYSHAMGNANGSLADYWRAIESTPGLQGGFIWDWIDQGIAAEMETPADEDKQGGKYWKYGGDFGDSPSDYDFCLNGLNFPNQTPKPAMEECRHIFAPVRLYDLHKEQGIFEIENRNDFSFLSDIKLKFSILKNGIAEKSGVVKMPRIFPGEKSQIKIPAVLSALENVSQNEDIILRAEFVYANDTLFAKKGSLIRCDSFLISCATRQRIFPSEKIIQKILQKEISHDAIKFAENLFPQLFRAPIENELIKRDLPLMNDSKNQPASFLGKPTRSWLNSGLANLQVKKIAQNKFELCSPNNALEKKSFGTFSLETKNAFALDKTPALEICATFNLKNSLEEFPRVGISTFVSAEFENIKWYGQGPHECYSDRCDSAQLAMHSKKISELETPYIVPQENATRCGTYYVEIFCDKKILHLQSETPFSFSILKYTAQDLFAKEHTAELKDLTRDKKNPRWIFNIDAAHRGVGTGACGPDTLEKYRVRPGIYKLKFLVW